MKINTMSDIRIGDIARDSITGFEGVVVARTEWLNGCARIAIQPKKLNKDGKPIDMETFDENQVMLVKAGNHSAARSTGGPRPAPVRLQDPKRIRS